MSHLQINILIDALGWELAPARALLADELPQRGPVRTVLGFSSGAIPTLLSGKPPAETGHWNLYYRDPAGSPFAWLRHFGFVPDRVLDHRISRRLLTEMGRRVLGLGPLFECNVPPRHLPWFNYVEKRNLYAPGGVSGAPTIFDLLAQRRVPCRVYSYHHAGDAAILRQARRDIAAGEANFFFLYLSELDGFLHFHRQDPDAVAERVAWYGAELRSLLAIARGRDREFTCNLFSDHGMAPVRHRFDLVAAIEALGCRIGEDYLAIYDSTMARFWFFREPAETAIRQCLAGLGCGRILAESELRDAGCWFADRRFGECIFLMEPGWLMSRSHFNSGAWNPSGMHGYHPDDPDSNAVWLSNAAAPPPQTLADVYPRLAAAVGGAA